MPRNAILLPGMKLFGLAVHLSMVSSLQVTPDFATASEYLKSVLVPALRPNIPHRFGPIRFGPPSSNVWQEMHNMNFRWPSFIVASSGAVWAATGNADREAK